MPVILVKPRAGNKSAQVTRALKNASLGISVPTTLCTVTVGANLDTGEGFKFKSLFSLADFDAADRCKLEKWLVEALQQQRERVETKALDAPKATLASLALKLDQVLTCLAKAPAAMVLPTQVLAHVPTPAVLPNGPVVEGESPEDRLLLLLSTVEAACREIEQMMPERAGAFKRGYEFKPETARMVQCVWFKSADAIDAMSGRQPLKRREGWQKTRAAVLI